MQQDITHIFTQGAFQTHSIWQKLSGLTLGLRSSNGGASLEAAFSPRELLSISQSFENLKENMMTPRVGHSVSTFDKGMFIWGGVANFCLSPNKMYKFNAESWWHVQEHSGAAPRMRFNHVATKVESSQRLIVISGGLVSKMLREYLLVRHLNRK